MANSKISNSLSYFLEQALILEKNSLETVSKVSDAVTSQKDTVTITLTDPNNPSKTITYSIPSFGFLKSEIERLDNNIKTMSNIDSGSGSRVQLSDGTYRKIIASKLACEAPTITTVNNITNFNFKSNWLFEDMMSPYLYANIDLSDSVSIETEKVLIQRYILNCVNSNQVDFFNNIKSNSTKIEYKDFLQGLLNNGIAHVLDENYYELPPVRKRYSGEFEIDRILENTLSPNGKSILGRIILKSLSYTDNNTGIENTVSLKKNDILEIKENPVTTRYMVTSVNNATNEIKLKRLEGYTPILNSTIFKISSNQVKKISVEIPVSFDRREVIFVKAVDPDSNIPSNKWSPGIAFYSNELKYKNTQGEITTLESYYQKNVVDFGNIILSYSKDYYPSIVEGIKPDAPVLRYDSEDDSSSDFRIVQINKQLEEGEEKNTFKKLISEKENVLSQITNNNKLVEEQKELIQTTKFTTTTEKLNAQNKLAEYVKNQNTYTSLYNSIVNQIKSQYAATYIEKPKYRVRGFWSIPKPKSSRSSGLQQIIQFKVRYRYLSESGIANKEEEFTYLDGTTNATGKFSNWNEVLTPLRRRLKGSDGTYIWEKVDTRDPDKININQLDLPIQQGEQIEIQIKSISEAGFPANPMESDWSEPVIIAFSDFPELQGDDVSEIIAQNRVDASVANVVESMTGNSYAHMASSFYTNDKYFAHNAESITSGFLSPEQTPITLYDKLYDLQNQISAISEQIEKMNATMEVKLIDGEDNTKIYTLNEGSTTYINAGNYKDDKSKIDPNKNKGAIITKTYYIEISSDLQSSLEILSKIPGDRLSMCPNTISEAINIDYMETDEVIKGNDYKKYDNIMYISSIASDYYKTKGRYDLVPINLSSATETIDYQICCPNMYQSAQCKGQFIYSRFRNVSDTFDMYANTTLTSTNNATFDAYADFMDGENIYNFVNNNNDDKFWIERFNLYRPSNSGTIINNGKEIFDGYVSDIATINESQKKNLFNYIIELYDNLTGSSLSHFLYFTENDKTLYLWKNQTESTNVITDGIPENMNNVNIVGIYYINSNGDYDIYTEQTGDYIEIIDYDSENKTITCSYDNKGGSHKFILDTKFSTSISTNNPNSNGEHNGTMNNNNTPMPLSLPEDTNMDIQEVVEGAIQMKNSYDVIRQIEIVINRLPKTFKKSPTALKTLYNNTKVVMRLNNLTKPISSNSRTSIRATEENNSMINTNVLQQSLIKATKIAARSSFDVTSVKTATLNQIEPKIQATYGYADLGNIIDLNIDGDISSDYGSYVTTHKIGYEESDRYRVGEMSCDSFLFLSPLTHSDIQVNGDSNKSNISIKSNESLRVPIIYQYRMEDYNNNIFGNKKYKSTDQTVKNAKFANIIGIDIWLNTLSDTPKQYDIVVYSTYDKDSTRATGVVTKKLNK